jgi:hypothetical protein
MLFAAVLDAGIEFVIGSLGQDHGFLSAMTEDEAAVQFWANDDVMGAADQVSH